MSPNQNIRAQRSSGDVDSGQGLRRAPMLAGEHTHGFSHITCTIMHEGCIGALNTILTGYRIPPVLTALEDQLKLFWERSHMRGRLLSLNSV